MNGTWANIKLGALVQFRNGRAIEHEANGPYFIYGSNGVIGSTASFLYKRAVIIGRVGAYCGSVAFSEGPFWATDNTIVVEAREGAATPRFLYYLLKEANLNQYAGGSAQPLLTHSRLRPLSFQVPPLQEQLALATVISAYDELIDVNRRRIATLESMARGVFEGWFVRLRYPGHEEAAAEEVGDGVLPAGWRAGTLADVAEDTREAVMPADVPPDTRYVGLEHIPRRSTTLNSFGRAAEVDSLKLRFRRGDLLFGKIRPYLHKAAWASFDGVASSDAIVLRPTRDRYSALVTCITSSGAFIAYAVQTSNGTKMPRANWSVLKNYPVPLPPDSLLHHFNSSVMPLIENAAVLQASSDRLAATRDLLLPRLLSGRLMLRAAERQLADAA